VDALQRLLDGRGFTSQVALDALLHYPALLALRTMSIVTIDEGRDDFLIELLTHPRWTDPYGRRGPANAAEVLHINRALDGDMINKLPRWEGKVRWLYPQSHFLKTVLQEVVTENGVESTRYEQLCDDVEYRTGLVQLLTAAGTPRPNMGKLPTRVIGTPQSGPAPRTASATTSPGGVNTRGPRCSAAIRPMT
jgi:hypothetical protein